MSPQQYPEDEFDQAGKEGPAGLHRQRPSRWKSVLPFLLVLIIVPLVAWGAVSLLTGRDGSEQAETPEETTAAAFTTQPSTEAEETEPTTEASQTEATTQEPTEAPTEAEISRDVAIQVLNGTRRNGLAADAVSKLQAEGYQQVTAANASGWRTEVTTIYFQPGKQAGAEALGQILGISNFQENGTDLGNSDFIVILKGDY